ncbi:10782_t:CDS:2 [Paraglomus brasilianum]|uniref:10782_t:CDS:1 n=1 Tax=Paraglomus brasilianum TaxID=144538 RepID=A0A9N8ZQD8_9GLOM|nr:10782_t:CDS:2 [Paraglomus brasilianum]
MGLGNNMRTKKRNHTNHDKEAKRASPGLLDGVDCNLVNDKPYSVNLKATGEIFLLKASRFRFKTTYLLGEKDELGAEQEERRRYAHLNKEFSEKIAEAVSIRRVEVDILFRELEFSGFLSEPTSIAANA